MSTAARYQREESTILARRIPQRWTPGWKPGLFPSMAPEHNLCCCTACLSAQPRRRLTLIAHRAKMLKLFEEVVGDR